MNPFHYIVYPHLKLNYTKQIISIVYGREVHIALPDALRIISLPCKEPYVMPMNYEVIAQSDGIILVQPKTRKVQHETIWELQMWLDKLAVEYEKLQDKSDWSLGFYDDGEIIEPVESDFYNGYKSARGFLPAVLERGILTLPVKQETRKGKSYQFMYMRPNDAIAAHKSLKEIMGFPEDENEDQRICMLDISWQRKMQCEKKKE
jgi:hypothetical protein